MHTNSDLDSLEILDNYRQHFMDPDLWERPVRWVCRQHNLDCEFIRPGYPGTYPAFIVTDRWFIKFFGTLFNGAVSYRVEAALGKLIKPTEIAAPAMLFKGIYQDNQNWCYLVFEYIPGVSIGEVLTEFDAQNKLRVAQWLGKQLAVMHALPLPNPILEQFPPDPRAYADRLQLWFQQRSSRGDLGLPEHLARQCQAYLQQYLPTGSERIHLIHADVTRDHVLGNFCGDRWQPQALIDFGDSMSGNLYYELIALHLDAFDCDIHMLEAFLNAYGTGVFSDPSFPHRCMAAALQHQFNVFEVVFQRHPHLANIRTIPELAEKLYWKGIYA